MASKAVASTALLLSLNLLFFTMVSSAHAPFPPTPNSPKIPPSPNPKPPSSKGTCPIDTLKFGVCANVLNWVNATVGSPPTLPCCSLISGLADIEVAVCLRTALKANILGINLNIPLSLSAILNNCGKDNSGFRCPY